MARRLVGLLVILLGLAAPAACGRDIELSEALAVTDVLSGYYDNGVKDGKTQLRPQHHLQTQESGRTDGPGIELDVAFWEEGRTGEMDSVADQSDWRGWPRSRRFDRAAHRPVPQSVYTLEGARDDVLHQ